METFKYNGVTLKKATSAKRGYCEGCYFEEHNIPCTSKEVPECGSNNIFIECSKDPKA